jgi:hypothetical protein
MESLNKLILEIVGEIEKNILTIETVLTTTAERNISDILTEMRAIYGVTIVSSMVPTKNVGRGVHLSHVKIKFLPIKNIPRKLFMLKLHQQIMSISGTVKARFIKLHSGSASKTPVFQPIIN